MKHKKILTLFFISLMMFTWATTAASAGQGDNCPDDHMPDHVGDTIQSHTSNGYLHFWKGIHNPPGCRAILPR